MSTLLGEYRGVKDDDEDPFGGMDAGVRELKVWKNARKVGAIDIEAANILGPTEEIRAREFDANHCAVLEKKLQATGSSNAKGVKLVVLNQALETQWLAADSATRKAMFQEGHEFYKAIMASPLYAVGGDHTRTAVTNLNQQFPHMLKWQMFKQVTVFVSSDTPPCHQMLKSMGVMYNAKQYHKDMGFADHILIIHKYFKDKGMLVKGVRRTEEVKIWCERQGALAGIPKNSWSQFSACAKLDGQAWYYMEAILKGQYASKIGRGSFPANVPTSQSPFIKIMTCPNDVIESTLKEVYNGTIGISQLNTAAENYKAYALAKDMIVWVVQKETCENCSEKTVRGSFPYLMKRGFILDFVPGVKALMKKNSGLVATDVPVWLKSKVTTYLMETSMVKILRSFLS